MPLAVDATGRRRHGQLTDLAYLSCDMFAQSKRSSGLSLYQADNLNTDDGEWISVIQILDRAASVNPMHPHRCPTDARMHPESGACQYLSMLQPE